MLKAASLALFALTLSAADFNGIWLGQIPTRNGQTQDVAFQFTQSGAKLSGKMYGDYQSAPITNGVVAGELVTFVVVAEEQAGNQINHTRLRFSGTFKDGAIELLRDRESSTNAGDGGDVQFRGSTRASLTLKKLL